jgi:hypothetical protein
MAHGTLPYIGTLMMVFFTAEARCGIQGSSNASAQKQDAPVFNT